jgi:ADP-ribosylglycohydrolase
MPPGSFIPVTEIVGGGPFNLEPGEWTDDTSMALCLATSLVEMAGFNPIDQLERYIRWYRTGYLTSNGQFFDIGTTISRALHVFERTREPYPGMTDTNSSGNGSLMRLAPVAMFYANQPKICIEKCADSSRTTHASRLAVDACRYYGAMIMCALNGYSKAELLSPPSELVFLDTDAKEMLASLDPEILEVVNGSYKGKMPPLIAGSGYVVRSMEAALWAFYSSASFKEGALMAANLGDDADTTTAIYGQLAGAYYGEEGIPAEWRSRLAKVDLIIGLADRIYEHIKQA